jgi:lipopolysaccharide export system permease protein
MYFFYIFKKYLKSFLLFLVSLSLLYLIIDIIGHFSKLPSSSNLQILYVAYTLGYSFENFYSLALIFAFLYELYYLIKLNYLVSFYSVGFSKLKVLKPFLSFAFFIYILFLFLENSNYAYLKQKAENIINNHQVKKENLFLKYEDKYGKKSLVFIKELKPLLNKAIDLKIFMLDNMRVDKIVVIPEAVYKDRIWIGKDAKVYNIFDKKIIIEKFKTIKVLRNFEPLVLSNLKKLDSISFKDAFVALKVFRDVKLTNIIAIVFYKIISPLTLIFLLIFFVYSSPIHQRLSNISFFILKSVFITILLWGIDLLLYKFIRQGVFSPFVLLIPLILVLILDLYVIKKEYL